MISKVKPLYIAFLLCFSSCGPFAPEIAKSIEDIATDDAVKVVITKEAIQKDTNVNITVGIQNKEVTQP